MSTVKIGDREFRIGATYAARDPMDRARWELVTVQPHCTLFPNGVVGYTQGNRHCVSFMSSALWLRWAGDEVQP